MPNDPTLVPFEHQILREVAGELPPSPWGAAVGEALEHLRSLGYTTRAQALTNQGREYLEKLPNAQS